MTLSDVPEFESITNVGLSAGGRVRQSSAEVVAAYARFGAVNKTGAAEAARNKARLDGVRSVPVAVVRSLDRVTSVFFILGLDIISNSREAKDPARGRRVLFDAVRCPQTLACLDLPSWNCLLDAARASGHAGRIAAMASYSRLPGRQLPRHLQGATASIEHQTTLIAWEVAQLALSAGYMSSGVMLLKGAAYIARRLTFAATRLCSDVDILLHYNSIQHFVAVSSHHGWTPTRMHHYDERYFREWMHELPPFRHSTRGTYLDIHHALLPKTSRLQPDTEKVWERAVQLPDSPLLVPCPEDMVLHCAFHAYHQGEFDNAPRDVIDMFDLLSHFTKNDPEFWARLVDRAAVIGVVPPLWHALSITHFIFDIGPPPAVQAHLDTLFPRSRSRDFVQRLIRRVTSYPVQTDAKAARAQALLHARSHYLRMPLPILARHLATKSFYNWQRGREAAKAQKAHLQQFKQ